MTRGILYLPGAGQHLLNQSARLIAELIARNLQALLGSTVSLHYRITLRPAARNSRAIEVEVGVLGVWVLRAGFSQSLGEHPSNSLSICYNACPKELQAVELPSDAFCAQRGEHR